MTRHDARHPASAAVSSTRRSRLLARVGDELGAAAVEFAIVAGLLFLLVFGIVDFGYGFHTWNASANAAREGARRAAVSADVTDIVARTRQAASTLNQANLTVTVTCSRTGTSFGPCPSASSWLDGDLVRVTVDYRYAFITPLGSMVGLGNGLNLQSTSEVRFEGL